jgi:hypothetical protein
LTSSVARTLKRRRGSPFAELREKLHSPIAGARIPLWEMTAHRWRRPKRDPKLAAPLVREHAFCLVSLLCESN